MNDYLLDKVNLAEYIICLHKGLKGKDITPIKLQKSLYFLFAFWGGKILLTRNGNKASEVDDILKEFKPYLFNADFVAWTYGPVDKEIWSKFKNNLLKGKSELLFNTTNNVEKDMAKEYLDDLLQKIFNTSDFALVDLSHEDQCWKQAINSEDQRIDSESIINEYAFR